MAFLYINSKGTPWRKHSYSAGNVFDQSPIKYYYQKVLGWREKDNKARFHFGRALETAIQHYHEHNGEGHRERFILEWSQHERNIELSFTRVEKDWGNCLRVGLEMLKLYEIAQPTLPIPLGGRSIFQREYAKEVFPNDPLYGEIEDVGKLDILAYVEPDHPKLPKLDWKSEYGPYRPLIIDIKTAATDFPNIYGLAAFDLQLRRYSWLSGIRDVAVLWFVKKSRSLQKGYSVTLLGDYGGFKAGQEAVIALMQDDKAWLVPNDYYITEMEKEQGVKEDKNGNKKPDQTAEGKARRDAWLQKIGVLVPIDQITKQRLQFNAGFVTIQSANEAGEIAARQIVNIVNAWRRKTEGRDNAYPSTFGIRFPKDDRTDPYFRAFVLNDLSFRKQNFIKLDEEALEDLYREEPTEEDQQN